MSLTVIPVKVEKEEKEFDLFKKMIYSLDKEGLSIQNGDVIVISSKYISNSQGRLIEYDRIKTSEHSKTLSQKFKIEQKLAEAIIRESDIVYGGIPGYVISFSDKILAPNAGIDKSNTKKSKLVLYPHDSNLVAEQLRRKFFLKFFKHIGIIIVDSRLMPARVGTSGIAIACSGIEPVIDMRAKKDLDGNFLKVTFQAVADNLASIANHKMGESSELRAFALIRNSGAKLTDRKISQDEMAISNDECIYIRGLKKF